MKLSEVTETSEEQLQQFAEKLVKFTNIKELDLELASKELMFKREVTQKFTDTIQSATHFETPPKIELDFGAYSVRSFANSKKRGRCSQYSLI